MARHSIVVAIASTYMRIQEISGIAGVIRKLVGYTPKTYELAKKEVLRLYGENGLLTVLAILTMDPEQCSTVQKIMGGRFAIRFVACVEVVARILPTKYQDKVYEVTEEAMNYLGDELASFIDKNADDQMEAYGYLEKFGFRSFGFDKDGNLIAVTHHPVWGESWTEAVN